LEVHAAGMQGFLATMAGAKAMSHWFDEPTYSAHMGSKVALAPVR
jgi:hypothetical protein